ncbi:MAG: hypothetical protein C4K60_11360 [Ideonella sp. MAG2]|nr:MAG: hypothetical protein C4K60_11360 [Ideonella sp. MAG2]
MQSNHNLNLPHPVRWLLGVLLAALLSLSTFPALATVTTGSTTIPRMMHTANTLLDGNILLAGGYARPGTAPYASAELYNPVTGIFTAVAPMQQARTEHAAVTLNDGRVMVFGGSIVTSPSLVGTATTEIFDPATGNWTYAANMSVARYRVQARLLPSGKVFVMNPDGYASIFYAEVYDPATNTFTKTGNMIDKTGYHGLVVLRDGRVLKIGGYASAYINRAEIWDPATNQWTATGSMGQPRQDIQPFVLPDGKVLVAGGANTMTLASTEIYDPATGKFVAGNPMSVAMAVKSATALSNGDFILMGDYSRSLARYQLATGQWNLTGPKRIAERGSSVSLLPEGNLLIVGGAVQNDASSTAAIWDKACAPQVIALSGSTSQTISPNGGQASFTVTAAAGCRFEVSGMPVWLTPSVPGPQTMPASGSMVVSFTAATNTTGASRSASFTLGNNGISITQPSVVQCPTAPTVSPSSFNFSAVAASGTIQVTAASTCSWRLGSLPSWAYASTSTSGTGNGTVTFQVAPNSGAARSATVPVTSPGFSSSVMINQAATAASCSTQISSGTFSGTLTAGCPSGARYYTSRYTFNGAPGNRVSILLSSTAFDSYLYLKSPNGTVIASNDDGGGGTNSRIPASSGVYVLPAGSAGVYTIEVSSYAPGATGPFTLSFSLTQ